MRTSPTGASGGGGSPLMAQPDEKVGTAALKYVNRLSDFLFVAARWMNDKGQSDLLWTPGQNR